jgi:hypothetical protein
MVIPFTDDLKLGKKGGGDLKSKCPRLSKRVSDITIDFGNNKG